MRGRARSCAVVRGCVHTATLALISLEARREPKRRSYCVSQVLCTIYVVPLYIHDSNESSFQAIPTRRQTTLTVVLKPWLHVTACSSQNPASSIDISNLSDRGTPNMHLSICYIHGVPSVEGTYIQEGSTSCVSTMFKKVLLYPVANPILL